VAASTVPAFDRLAVTVLPGTDVVVRLPGVLLVAGSPDTTDGDQALQAVLDLLEASGEAGTRAPGYRLSRALRDLLDAGAAPVDLALVAATDDGLAIVLAGTGTATVVDHGWRLRCDNGPVLARETDWPPAPLLLDVGASVAGGNHTERDHRLTRPSNLREGVVPGSGAILASPPPVMTQTGTVQLGDGALPSAARVASHLGPGGPTPPNRFDQILGVRPAGPRRSALPLVGAGADSEQAATGTKVRGYRCRDGHLNDPRTLFCAICGIRMAESTGVFVEGPRPPLGLLVFDNGASFSLDEDYLLGREPDVDERVRTGQLRPLVLFDTRGVISRRHAEIRLEDWDVLLLDCGSANGTLVAERDAALWSALVPGQPVRLLPSMQVRIGERSFVFESLHGAP